MDTPQNYYARKHDTLLWYTKTEKWTFERQFGTDTEDTIDFKRWKAYLDSIGICIFLVQNQADCGRGR